MSLEAEVESLRARCCTGKACLSERAARRVAAASRTPAQPEEIGPLDAYRCPFADEHPDGEPAWHVGHAMSRDGLSRMARVLRWRAGHAPAPVAPEAAALAERFRTRR